MQIQRLVSNPPRMMSRKNKSTWWPSSCPGRRCFRNSPTFRRSLVIRNWLGWFRPMRATVRIFNRKSRESRRELMRQYNKEMHKFSNYKRKFANWLLRIRNLRVNIRNLKHKARPMKRKLQIRLLPWSRQLNNRNINYRTSMMNSWLSLLKSVIRIINPKLMTKFMLMKPGSNS